MVDNATPVVSQTTSEPSTPSSEPVAVKTPEAVVSTAISSDATPAVTQASAPATEAPAAEPSDTAPQGGRVSERIQDLVAERNAAKEYAEYWRQRALELVKPQVAAKTPEPVDPVTAKVEAVLAQRDQRQQQESIIDNYVSKVNTFKKDHPDFDLVTSNPSLPSLDRLAASMVLSSEQSAALTYHLARNPEEAVRIARQNPAQQALAIGRLEATLRQPKPAPVPAVTTPTTVASIVAAPGTAPPVVPVQAQVVTQAPEPPTPVPSGGNPETSMEGSEVGDWMKMRMREERVRRRTGRLA